MAQARFHRLGYLVAAGPVRIQIQDAGVAAHAGFQPAVERRRHARNQGLRLLAQRHRLGRLVEVFQIDEHNMPCPLPTISVLKLGHR